MTTKTEIRAWLERAKEQGASHMFVVCDTFDWEDYPKFHAFESAEKARAEAERYPRGMNKLMEVYRLDMDWDDQLRASRSFNY